MTNWRPIKTLYDLDSIESRLSKDRRVIVTNIPGKGLCYKVVKNTKHRHKRNKGKHLY
jgi:hypothetical protein